MSSEEYGVLHCGRCGTLNAQDRTRADGYYLLNGQPRYREYCPNEDCAASPNRTWRKQFTAARKAMPKFGLFHNYNLTWAAHFMAMGDWSLRWTGLILGPIAIGVMWRAKCPTPGALIATLRDVEERDGTNGP
jgi:hypothetical protein